MLWAERMSLNIDAYMRERVRYRRAFKRAAKKAGQEVRPTEEPSPQRMKTLIRRYLRKQ
jgi:hypothetical protein